MAVTCLRPLNQPLHGLCLHSLAVLVGAVPQRANHRNLRDPKTSASIDALTLTSKDSCNAHQSDATRLQAAPPRTQGARLRSPSWPGTKPERNSGLLLMIHRSSFLHQSQCPGSSSDRPQSRRLQCSAAARAAGTAPVSAFSPQNCKQRAPQCSTKPTCTRQTLCALPLGSSTHSPACDLPPPPRRRWPPPAHACRHACRPRCPAGAQGAEGALFSTQVTAHKRSVGNRPCRTAPDMQAQALNATHALRTALLPCPAGSSR